MIALLVVVGFYVGWNIGANDTANCIGTPVGSGLISYRKMIYLVVIFVLLGALLQSHNVMKTIGEGVVLNPVNMKTEIAGGWLATPTAAALFSFLLYKGIGLIPLLT